MTVYSCSKYLPGIWIACFFSLTELIALAFSEPTAAVFQACSILLGSLGFVGYFAFEQPTRAIYRALSSGGTVDSHLERVRGERLKMSLKEIDTDIEDLRHCRQARQEELDTVSGLPDYRKPAT